MIYIGYVWLLKVIERYPWLYVDCYYLLSMVIDCYHLLCMATDCY